MTLLLPPLTRPHVVVVPPPRSLLEKEETETGCDDDLGAMLRGERNMRAVMQLLSRYLPEYRMSLLTTKCLNTAVMVMYLALGDAALVTTRQCDVEPVRKRRALLLNQKDEDRDAFASRGHAYQDLVIARRLRERVLGRAATSGGRQLHYVMLTDGDMPPTSSASSSSGPPPKKYFPGHVFVIESFPSGDGGVVQYRLYQSYVNQYDVVQHAAMRRQRKQGNFSPTIDREELERMLDGLVEMASSRTWTPRTSEFWSWFARVPLEHAAQFEGYSREGVVLMCHRHVRADRCARALRALARRALGDAEAGNSSNSAIWGDEKLYDAKNGAKPLTVGEMREILTPWTT